MTARDQQQVDHLLHYLAKALDFPEGVAWMDDESMSPSPDLWDFALWQHGFSRGYQFGTREGRKTGYRWAVEDATIGARKADRVAAASRARRQAKRLAA